MVGVEEGATVRREHEGFTGPDEMAARRRFGYLEALKAELQEIIEEIRMMIEICKIREEAGEITNYVRWQNTALFIREIKGLSTLLTELYTINPHRFKDREQMMEYINTMFEKNIVKYDFPRAILTMVNGKLTKALNSTTGLYGEGIGQYTGI